MLTRTAIASFDDLIAGLAKINDEQVVRQLNNIFTAVGQMGTDKLVAAYHTVSTMRQLSEGEKSHRFCDELKRAIVARMQCKILDSDGSSLCTDRAALIELFTRVTGEEFRRYLV